MPRTFTFLTCLALLYCGALAAQEQPQRGPERWETTIAKFEAEDKEHPPAPGGVLFLGSSSIRLWNLEQCFPELQALNRGFGGSTVPEVLHYFDRIVTPYAPKTIVFYSGDNDIARGGTPEAVFQDYQAFFQRVHQALPEARILVLGIKPSIARHEMWPKMRQVNQDLQALAEKEAWITYIDTAPPLLGDDGMPKRDLLMDDGLHLNEAGYATWTPLVEAALKEAPVAQE